MKRARKYRKREGKACNEFLMGKRRDWKKKGKEIFEIVELKLSKK